MLQIFHVNLSVILATIREVEVDNLTLIFMLAADTGTMAIKIDL